MLKYSDTKRKLVNLGLVLATVLCMSIIFQGNVLAEGDAGTETESILSEAESVDVISFGADGFDKEDDQPAFLAALEKAKNAKTELIVTVPGGTYYLSKDIPIYSNTTLKLDRLANIVFTGESDGPMIYGAHLDKDGKSCVGSTCRHGGYDQVKNVKIEGGVWDRNLGGDHTIGTVISFRHATNITIKDLACRNANNHFINLSGVKDSVIDGVTITDEVHNSEKPAKNGKIYTPNDRGRYSNVEAIHLDYCNEEGEESLRTMPYDDTPSKNITISNCRFFNVYSCIGTHHPAVSERASDITINDCTANNVYGNCINLYDFDKVSIKNNTFTRCYRMGDFKDCTKVSLRGNTYTDTKGRKIGGDDRFFLDVTNPSAYYYQPSYWLADRGLNDGYNNATFRPLKNCSRISMTLFLWYLAGKPETEGEVYFTDVEEDKDSNSYKAIQWGCTYGIFRRDLGSEFNANEAISRLECLIMMYKFEGSPDVYGEVSYYDVADIGYDFFSDEYQAVLWAELSGIINGYPDGGFYPFNDCLRGDAATFIYRYAKPWWQA